MTCDLLKFDPSQRYISHSPAGIAHSLDRPRLDRGRKPHQERNDMGYSQAHKAKGRSLEITGSLKFFA